jgi:hypothetical protein
MLQYKDITFSKCLLKLFLINNDTIFMLQLMCTTNLFLPKMQNNLIFSYLLFLTERVKNKTICSLNCFFFSVTEFQVAADDVAP